ncbi:MAG: AEC family transporter, partial [Salinisphaera sp.]|nr:AEC family transporter [Salinisphaera sp.]
RHKPRTMVPPAMFNNCGNMGLPLAVFAFGESALPVAVILLVVTGVLQFSLGLWILHGRLDLASLVRNPMLLATAAGVVAMLCDWHAPTIIEPAVAMLAQVAIPLMLVALGMRLAQGSLGDWRAGVLGGLLTPATGLLVALPLLWFMQAPEPLAGMLILYAALPPAVMNYMLAEQARQEPDTVAAVVAVGNAMALVIIPATLWFVL